MKKLTDYEISLTKKVFDEIIGGDMTAFPLKISKDTAMGGLSVAAMGWEPVEGKDGKPVTRTIDRNITANIGGKNVDLLSLKLKTKQVKFKDENGEEQQFTVPVLSKLDDMSEIISFTKDLAYSLLVLRDYVMLIEASNKEYVKKSTTEPLTGVFLADALVGSSSGLITQDVNKKLIGTKEDVVSKVSNQQIITQYNNKTAVATGVNIMLRSLLTDFIEGRDIHVELAKERKQVSEVSVDVESSTVTPVVTHRVETPIEEIKDTAKPANKRTKVGLI